MTTDHIDTAAERVKLERLADHTPGPWWTPGKYSGHQMGCSIIASNPNAGPAPGNPTRGEVAFATAILNTDARRCEGNARLIAAAPDLLATVHRLLDIIDAKDAENQRLREALTRIANYREEAHAHDDDMGHLRRCFDVEAVMFMEAIARTALSSTEASHE